MSFVCSQVRPLRGDSPPGLEAFKHRRQRGLRAQDPRLWPGEVKVDTFPKKMLKSNDFLEIFPRGAGPSEKTRKKKI